MNRIARAVLVSSLFVSSASFAQDAEFNMQVDVEDQDMPSARIKMKTTTNVDGEETTTVKVRGGGARMDVRVTGGMTETESHSETRTTETRREPRMEPRHEMPMTADPAYRDCGTRSDEGCMMRRDGQYPMDASTWRGFYQSLKSENNEIVRQEKAEKMLKRVYLTAVQFGMVLDLFNNEITRLEVAKEAAPHVVDPQHALGFSSKWRNSISGSEYTDIITQ
ncbi:MULTISPECIES: DUF4476 domain-containing protein [unclassified Corallococcus]|uniref:DUF4476 domain-containing protein n=1 Tax=unclassified Corallococcus TaxID=2685029 RepID=UPI001A8C54A7|nr:MULTISPECIES: DUF4476 domain-containing protein [unclassified Corallococcus]MBN9687185.1 DUF4476 domain-containing protein [Corallococcus sp. NCSPR001]WAS88988.1 DUF4476 domain-containing protein [Corallococcus sp. NCRR]